MNWFKRALMRALAAKGSQIAIVGTVLHQDSLLNNALNGEKGFAGWRRHRWAALNTREDGTVYSLWPSMFPVENLVRMRDDPDYDFYLGPLAFGQEMQNQAIDETNRVIKSEWIFGPADTKRTFSLTEVETRWAAEHPPARAPWLAGVTDPAVAAALDAR